MPFLSDRFHEQNRRDGRTDLTGPSGPPAPVNRTGAFDAATVASAVGDRVLFGKYAATEQEIDGEELLIVREADILAVIYQDNAVEKAA